MDSGIDVSEEDLDEDWLTLCESLGDDPNVPIRPPTENEDSPPTLSEVLLTVLDWYSAHKQTYTATTDLFRVLAMVVPPGTTLNTFSQVRSILEKHRLDSCEVYDACRTGCIVYKNFSGVFEDHQYADLDECPNCEQPRYVGMGSFRRVSHSVYFFPIARYLRDMFRREDLVRHLDHRPTSRTPSSSLKKSRGYRDKMLRDPILNADHRNQGIVISSDGIPYFGAGDKHSRGAWPIVARLASLPDGMWDRFEYAHLYVLEAQEHWSTDVETGEVHRKRKCVL